MGSIETISDFNNVAIKITVSTNTWCFEGFESSVSFRELKLKLIALKESNLRQLKGN